MSLEYKLQENAMDLFQDDEFLGCIVFEENIRDSYFENSVGMTFACGGEYSDDQYLLDHGFREGEFDIGFDYQVVVSRGELPIGGDILLIGVVGGLYESIEVVVRIVEQNNGIIYFEVFDSEYGGGKLIPTD